MYLLSAILLYSVYRVYSTCKSFEGKYDKLYNVTADGDTQSSDVQEEEDEEWNHKLWRVWRDDKW